MKLTDVEKEAIISKALNTDEGRETLAKSMVEPLRRAMNYAGIARKILAPQPLPQGAIFYPFFSKKSIPKIMENDETYEREL